MDHIVLVSILFVVICFIFVTTYAEVTSDRVDPSRHVVTADVSCTAVTKTVAHGTSGWRSELMSLRN